MIGLNYYFPNMVPVASFATYIGLRMEPYLDLPKATTGLIFFGLITQMMFRVPNAITTYMQLLVSMKRVQEFLEVPEVQPNVRVTTRMKESAVEVQGNFSWGF